MKKRSGAHMVPAVSEAWIQAETVKLLQRKRVFCHSVPNEAAGKDVQRMPQLIGMGLRSGVADLVVWWPDGIGYLEMKTPQGRLSEKQLAFQRKCREKGVSYDVAHSVDEAIAIMQKHGVKIKEESDGV